MFKKKNYNQKNEDQIKKNKYEIKRKIDFIK